MSRTVGILLLMTTISIGFNIVLINSAQASNLAHVFYYGSSTQAGCIGKCEQLVTTTGTADTATSVKVGSSTACCFQVEPDVSSSTMTGPPSDITPSGFAWVLPIDQGGTTVQSGTWQFDTTVTASRTGTATMRFLAWSCLTATESGCTLLFDFTGANNIEAATAATQNTDLSPIVGPFLNLHFLTIEVWISPTVSTGSNNAVDTMTTVSGASDVITPSTNFSRSLSGTGTLTASIFGKISEFRSSASSLALVAAVSVSVNHVNSTATTTSVSCSKNKGSITCTATVASTGSPTPPTGIVAWTTTGTGTFSPSSCTISGTGASSTCSTSYTPGGVKRGSVTITGTYSGDSSHLASSGSTTIKST